MSVVSRGFGGRRQADPRVPPGQYRTDDFPVLTAGPTPLVSTDAWTLEVSPLNGPGRSLSWQQLMALPVEDITVDLHCVTKWSKLGTRWRGVRVSDVFDAADADLGGVEHVMAHSHGGYTTNLPLRDLLDGRAWIAFEFDGRPLAAVHGGPARLLVPHLYLWKSAKWVNRLELLREDRLGFWENLGYHAYGDPWLAQRYTGD